MPIRLNHIFRVYYTITNLTQHLHYRKHLIHPTNPPSHQFHPPSNPLLHPSTIPLAPPTAPSFTLSTSLSALLNSSGPTSFPNSILRCRFLCAPLASLNANSASSPFLSASFLAERRDSAVTGGMATVRVRGSVGVVVGVREGRVARAERMGLRCWFWGRVRVSTDLLACGGGGGVWGGRS